MSPLRMSVIAMCVASSSANADVRSTKSHVHRCAHVVAENYDYEALNLVGIVKQGPWSKALFMDPEQVDHVVTVGDCLGKQRAFVKTVDKDGLTLEMNSKLVRFPVRGR